MLILDLDETLVFGSEEALMRPADLHAGPFHIYLRPYLAPFLTAVSQWFNLAVWTSAGDTYAAEIVSRAFPEAIKLHFVWSNERCGYKYHPETGGYHSLKDLRKVKRRGYRLERVLVLDDSPEKLQRHYGNHLRVRPFVGAEDDRELEDILSYLKLIRDVPNLRNLEKRNWRDQVRKGPVIDSPTVRESFSATGQPGCRPE